MTKKVMDGAGTLARLFGRIARIQDEARDGLRAEPVISRHCNAFRYKLATLKLLAYAYAVAKWWTGRPAFNSRYVEYLALARWRSDEYAALREAMDATLNARDPNIVVS